MDLAKFEVPQQPVAVERVRVFLQQVGTEVVNVVEQVLLVSANRQVDLGELDPGVPVILIGLRDQLHGAPQRLHRLGRRPELEFSQPQFVVRRPEPLVLQERVLVHDAGFFVFSLGKILIPAFEVTDLRHIWVAAARNQTQQDRQQNGHNSHTMHGNLWPHNSIYCMTDPTSAPYGLGLNRLGSTIIPVLVSETECWLPATLVQRSVRGSTPSKTRGWKPLLLIVV